MDVDLGEGLSTLDQQIEATVKRLGFAERNSTSALLNIVVTDTNGQEYLLLMARKRGAESKPTMGQIGGAAAVPDEYLDRVLSHIQSPDSLQHVDYVKQEVNPTTGLADLRVSGFTNIEAQIQYEQSIARLMKTETAPNIMREINEELANPDNEWDTLVKRLSVHGLEAPTDPPDALKDTLIAACLAPTAPAVIRPAETNRISPRSGKEEKTHSLICEMTVYVPMDQIAQSIEDTYMQVIDKDTTVIQSPFVLIPVEIARELSENTPDEEDEIATPYTIGDSKTTVHITSNALKAA